MKEHTPFFKMQTKDVLHGWNLTNLLNVCHRMFLSIGPCFQGPIHG